MALKVRSFVRAARDIVSGVLLIWLVRFLFAVIRPSHRLEEEERALLEKEKRREIRRSGTARLIIAALSVALVALMVPAVLNLEQLYGSANKGYKPLHNSHFEEDFKKAGKASSIEALSMEGDSEPVGNGDRGYLYLAATQLFKVCPRLAEITGPHPQVTVYYYGNKAPHGWMGTNAYFGLMVTLPAGSEAKIPARYAGSAFPEFGLLGGDRPGILALRALPRWLCNKEDSFSDYDLVQRHKRDGIAYEHMMTFIPLTLLVPGRS